MLTENKNLGDISNLYPQDYNFRDSIRISGFLNHDPDHRDTPNSVIFKFSLYIEIRESESKKTHLKKTSALIWLSLFFSFICQTENLDQLDEIVSARLLSEKESSNISCSSEKISSRPIGRLSKRTKSDPAIKTGNKKLILQKLNKNHDLQKSTLFLS